MDIRVKADGFPMSPATRDYLDQKLAHIEKLLAADAPLTRCEVELGRDAGRPRHGANIWFAEIQVKYPGGETIRATNRSESINGAIDDAQEEIKRQIRNEKRVHMRLYRRGGRLAKRLLRLEE